LRHGASSEWMAVRGPGVTYSGEHSGGRNALGFHEAGGGDPPPHHMEATAPAVITGTLVTRARSEGVSPCPAPYPPRVYDLIPRYLVRRSIRTMYRAMVRRPEST
jgi:hypothetical protein